MPILRLALVLAVLVASLGVGSQAMAQEDPSLGSFLNPFPSSDIYSLQVIGDETADGLAGGLGEAFAVDRRVEVRPKTFRLNGLARSDFAERLQALEDEIKAEPVNIAVVMMGAFDRISLRSSDGRRLQVGSPPWRAEFGQRCDRLLKSMKRQNVAVYWVGLPNTRRTDANEDVQMMNEVVRERVYANGFKFIDAYAGFLDEQGGFNPWGPDITGKMVRLRDNDGSWFTAAGNRKLAHFVERDLKRDITQAKSERAIPLAGSESEQVRINPDRARLAPAAETPAGGTARGTDKPVEGAASASPSPAAAGGLPSGDQRADNGKVTLKLIGQTGHEEIVTIDIVRPAISASVVQLVTRRESPDKPSQMGDSLVDQIPGGLTIMSSVTPSSVTGATGPRKLSAAQTPYFRVLYKGERLAPRSGRSDDFTWPRPEGEAGADPTPASTGPDETGSTPAPAAAPASEEASDDNGADRPRKRRRRQ